MVTNHSSKAKARELMALSEGRLSYTEAQKLAANLQARLTMGQGSLGSCYTVAEASALGLRWEHLTDNFSNVMSDADLRLASIAAATLSPERDLVIFGQTNTGKSTVVGAVLAATGLTAKILQTHYRHDGELLKGPKADGGEAEILIIDEVQRLNGSKAAYTATQLRAASRRIIVVHAASRHGVNGLIERAYADVELRDPFYLESTRSGQGVRGLKLIDPQVEAALLEISGTDPWEASVLADHKGTHFGSFLSEFFEANRWIREGRDLVIFGGPKSGKSAIADSLVEAAELSTVLIVPKRDLSSRKPSGSTWTMSSEQVEEGSLHGQILRIGPDLVAIDELKNPSQELEALLNSVAGRLFVVSASSAEEAMRQISELLPSVELRNPALVEPQAASPQRSRSVRLIDPS